MNPTSPCSLLRAAGAKIVLATLGLAISSHAVSAQVAVDVGILTSVLESGDARVLVHGDSFSAPIFLRVFPAILTEWSFGPLTAIAGGAGPNAQLVQGLAPSPAIPIQAPPDGYELLRSTLGAEFFALPLRGMHEIYLSPTARLLEGDRLATVWLWLGPFANRGRPFAPVGQDVRMRPLLWSPTELALRAPSVFVDGVEVPLDGPPGQIAALPEIELTVEAGATRLGVSFDASPASAGSGSYFHPAGAVFYQVDNDTGERVPGLYYSYLADNSWSYVDFASDEPAASNDDKRFSIEQMSHWLRATTIDPDQSIVVLYYLAAEPVGAGGGEAHFEEMVDKTRDAVREAGLGPVVHGLILPHFHAIAGDTTRHDLFVAQRDAMFRVADRRPDVAAISLYDATDARLLTQLLDTAQLHPNAVGAGCFAHQIATVLDPTTPWSCFVDSFGSGDTSGWTRSQ